MVGGHEVKFMKAVDLWAEIRTIAYKIAKLKSKMYDFFETVK